MKWLSFIATGQSGHTAVAACLDAHPNIVISEEQNVVHRVWRKRSTREEAIQSCIEASQSLLKNKGSHRKQDIPINGKWSGKWEDPLLIVGNKMGWEFTGPIMKGGNKLNRFNRIMKTPVKFLHVQRNPYDVISSWGIVRQKERVTRTGKIRRVRSLDQCVDVWIDHMDAAKVLYGIEGLDIKMISIENFCRDIQTNLEVITKWLGVSNPKDWNLECAKAVFKEPRFKRHLIKWPTSTADKVIKYMNTNPELFIKEYFDTHKELNNE